MRSVVKIRKHLPDIQLLQALRVNSFALLWSGQTISLLGDNVFSIALAWIVISLTGSSVAMSLVVVAQIVPSMIFMLLGGVIADRLPKISIMLWSDLSRGIIVLVIMICGLFHVLQFWQLLLMALVFGIVDSFFSPAYQSLTPQIVNADRLTSANSLTALSRQLSQSIGPAIGALCITFIGTSLAFGVDGFSFFISVGCLLVLRLPQTLKVKSPIIEKTYDTETSEVSSSIRHNLKDIARSMKEGINYVKSTPWIWVTILLASVANVGYAGPMTIVLPKLILDTYHAGPWLLGLLGTIGALGAITGTIAIGQIKHLRHRGIIAYSAMILSSLALLGFGLPFPDQFRLAIACIASGLAGFCLSIFQIVWVTLLQELVPVEKLGRVSSVDMLGSYSLLPAGFILMGFLSDHFGPSWVFLGGGFLILLIASIGLCLPEIRKLQ